MFFQQNDQIIFIVLKVISNLSFFSQDFFKNHKIPEFVQVFKRGCVHFQAFPGQVGILNQK